MEIAKFMFKFKNKVLLISLDNYFINLSEVNCILMLNFSLILVQFYSNTQYSIPYSNTNTQFYKYSILDKKLKVYIIIIHLIANYGENDLIMSA